jgi:hypothetical protein
MVNVSLSKPSRPKGEQNVYIPLFVSALDAGEWSTSHFGCLTPWRFTLNFLYEIYYTPLISVVRLMCRAKIVVVKVNMNIMKDRCIVLWLVCFFALTHTWRIALYWFESATVWNLTVLDHFLLQSPISNCSWWMQRKQFGWFFRNDLVQAFLRRHKLHFHWNNQTTTNNVQPVDTNMISCKWKWQQLHWQQWKGWLLWSTLTYLHFHVVIIMSRVSCDWSTGKNKTGTQFLWSSDRKTTNSRTAYRYSTAVSAIAAGYVALLL